MRGNEVAKSAILFVVCDTSAAGAGAAGSGDGTVPAGGVAAGMGGTASTGWLSAPSALAGGALVLLLAVAAAWSVRGRLARR